MCRIVSFEKLGDAFVVDTVQLKYTPRKFAVCEESGWFVVIESECGIAGPTERNV